MNDLVHQTIQGLNWNHMAGYYSHSIAELHEIFLSFIQPGECIGCGDSLTLEQTGIFDLVRAGTYRFLDKYQPGLSHQDKREIYLQNFRADTFITGVNAVTMDGKLLNIDGNGSRVAPMIYGPEQVIVVAGTNKIAESLEDAMTRVRQTAAPLDAKRLKKNTPCAKLGRCVDCHHPERICNDFVMIAGQFTTNRIKVIFVEGSYGL